VNNNNHKNPTKNVVNADKYNDMVKKANAMAKQPVNVGIDVTWVMTPFRSRKPSAT